MKELLQKLEELRKKMLKDMDSMSLDSAQYEDYLIALDWVDSLITFLKYDYKEPL